MRIPKAYFIDIDGTLTNVHNGGTLNNIDEKAIKAAARDGAHIILSTGRAPQVTIPIWEQIDIKNDRTRYLICNNGSVILDARTNEVIFEDYMDRMDFVLINQLLYNRGFIIKNAESSRYYSKNTLLMRTVRAFSKVTIEKSLDKLNYNNVSARKIGCISYKSKYKVRRLAKEIRSKFPGVEVSISGPGLYLEITKKNANKGTATVFMTKYLAEFNLEDTCHIGDSMNDASAFAVVGTSVYVSSGMKELKKLADFTTSSVSKNGVAKAIDSLRQKRK